MRKRIALWISLAAALALGLILPSGALRTIDGRLTRGEWVVEAPFGEYRYGGTLENRVRALAAYRPESASPKRKRSSMRTSGASCMAPVCCQ